jgi:hypothetical protein
LLTNVNAADQKHGNKPKAISLELMPLSYQKSTTANGIVEDLR